MVKQKSLVDENISNKNWILLEQAMVRAHVVGLKHMAGSSINTRMSHI